MKSVKDITDVAINNGCQEVEDLKIGEGLSRLATKVLFGAVLNDVWRNYHLQVRGIMESGIQKNNKD
jgi:hypothetical protein